jgi:hypothetical protein
MMQEGLGTWTVEGGRVIDDDVDPLTSSSHRRQQTEPKQNGCNKAIKLRTPKTLPQKKIELGLLLEER